MDLEGKFEEDEDSKEYVCLRCGKRIPFRYSSAGTHGTKQLMRLWAWHNFKRHLKACWRKEGDGEDL